MNELSAPSRLPALLALLAALLLAACGQGGDGARPPLEGARIGGPFTLTDQTGAKVSDTDFAGRYRLIYFGFTYCPDVCPTDMQAIGAAMRRLEQSDPDRAARVQPIFISVDPERDDPATVRQFVSAFHPRFVGLTGSPEEIAGVARAYGVYYARQGDAASRDYLVDHSRMAVLMGPEGQPIVLLPHEQGPDAIVAELQRWVR
ncbi:MAG: SCO family protein [Allosphingosinicella sp.]|uniref:SCO family protein n=1 Tax=Allosphingosinicella sp. TaxID=2823234 RepID=UPI0039245B40